MSEIVLTAIPATCERIGCDEPTAVVHRFDLIGAPEPAFNCWRHRRCKSTDTQTLEAYLAERQQQP